MSVGSNAYEINAHTMEVADSPDTVHTGTCHLWGFLVETDKTNDVTVVLSDGSTEIITYIVTGTTDSANVMFPKPIKMSTSLVVALAGTASRVVVLWSM
jgi:hypothetical protein